MEIWNKINKLKKCELIGLLYAYDKYVIETTDRNDGSCPVCLYEFFENDYQIEREK